MLIPGLKRWRKLVKSNVRRSNRRHNARRLGAVEVLEERCLLSNVAILGAESTGRGAQLADVQAKLQNTGLFSSVSTINTYYNTPTLAQLETYDSVLVYVDYPLQDPTTLGNNLADYVDAGHGVVLCAFANTNYSTPGGRWAAGGYNVISPADYSNYSNPPLTLGAVAQPGHPIMSGVTSFSGGTLSGHSLGGLTVGSTLIASWSNGSPLVAENNGFNGLDVSLNLYPPSSDVDSRFWDSSTDGALLMGNALNYAIGGLRVSSTDPADGSVVIGSTPTEYTVNVSNPLVADTVDATDFQVNGIDATGVSYTPGSTSLTFTFGTNPVTTQGVQTMHIDAGAFDRVSDGGGVQEFNGTFRWDAVLMQVTSTDPADGSTVLLPATTLDLNFNEAYDFSSAQPSDFTLNQGSVSAVSQVDADTLRLTLDGLTSEGTLTVNMAAGAMTDVYGNPGATFSASYTLDFGSYPYPVPLTPKAPLGSLIYDPSISGVISPAGDTDAFTINVDPGQTITVAVQTDPGLQASVTLLAGATGKVVVATGTASGAGQEVVVGPVATDGELNSDGQPAKTYRIVVAGANDTTGHYTVQFALNTALEDESHGGATNDTVATAQSLEPSFVQLHRATNADNLGPQPARAAVLGTLEAAPGTFSSIVDSEDFESGSLGAQWTTYSSQSNGRIRVTGAYGTAGGNYALLMDTSTAYPYNLNEAVWTVDLSGQTQATLQFAHRNFGDELNYLPSNFTGHYNGDGVAISDDGVHWHRVLNASYTSGWQTVKIDLAAEAAAAGMTLGPTFQIKFQQYDNFPLTADGRGYDNIVIGVPTPAQDTYSFSLQAGESATLTLNGSATLELQGATGATLALATTGAANVDQVISNFVASADGTYYARVSSFSETASDYTLLVTRNADFDTENNNDIASAQPALGNQVAGRQWALGDVTTGAATANPDFYQVKLAEGETLEVATATPGAGGGAFDDRLDPMVLVYDAAGNLVASDDNSADDGRNALLDYYVPTGGAGTYYVEMTASDATAKPTSGEYVLSVAGNTLTPPPFQVADTSIAVGTRLRGPTQMTVDFNGTILLTSLDASDLTINGVPATGFTVVDGDTVTFDLPTLSEGLQNVQIASIRNIQNTPLEPYNTSFYADITPPTVIDSSIQENDIIAMSGLTQNVTETVTFSEPMKTANLDNTDFSLHGALNHNYTPASASYDATGTILTLHYTNLPEDNYTLTLLSGDGRFEDTAQPNGWNLDGEFSGTFPSGNGVEGGNFVLDFNLDVGTAPFPTPLTPEAPLGSLIYDPSVTGYISPSGDTDSYTINLDAGQTISVATSPDFGLQPTIELRNSSNADVKTAAATADGKEAVLQTVATVAGTYTITVGGDGGTTGKYTLQATLNAALESESHGGPSNDTLATAQDINDSFIGLMNGADRGAVVGSLDGSADAYSFDLSAGESATVALKLSSTPGPFGARTDYSVGSRPYAIAYGDLNGDGYADMVTANYYSGDATVRLNNGGGAFGAPHSVGFYTPYASDVAIGDVNKDGKLDIVLSNRFGGSSYGSVIVMLGNGDGTFGSPIRSYLGYNTPGMALADFNGDGFLDVAQTRNFNADVVIGYGNGTGHFTYAGAYYAGAYPWRVAAADMNGDHTPDLVTANLGYYSDDVYTLLNNGSGTFGSATGYNNSNFDYSYGLAVGDVNGDGAPDVVTTNYRGGSVSLRLNTGTGVLGAATSYSTGGSYPRSVAIGDVNGDGKVDLAVANYQGSSASVLHGNGNGSFGSPEVYAAPYGSEPIDVALVDLNNDGLADLSSLNYYGSSVSVWLAQSLQLQLLDPSPSDTVVATGTSGAGNVDRLIYNYTATSTGTYDIRISGMSAGDYSLVVTRNAVFDREANNTPATAQNFDGVVGSLGYVGGSDKDWYSLHLSAGTAYSFPTTTPGDGPGQPVNTLDPHIVLYDPSGKTPLATGSTQDDGRNETIDFTPSADGLYLIQVTAEGGTSGEYFLDPAVVTPPAASSAGQVVASDSVGAAPRASGAETTAVGGLTLSAMVGMGTPQSAKVDEADAGLSWGPNAVPLKPVPALREGTRPTRSVARRFPLDDSADFTLPDEEPFNPDPIFADFNSLLDELIGVQPPA